METKNEIVVFDATKLDEVVKTSGIEDVLEGEMIKQSYQPFIMDLAMIQQQAGEKINFTNPSELDEKIARELRLKAVKIRTGAEALKDQRKKGYLLRGNLEQAAYNLIAASCKVTEEALNNIEKARELAEAKRKAALKLERADQIRPFVENPDIFPLGEMEEQGYNDLYVGLKAGHDAKQDRIRREEEDRIRNEQIEALRIERQGIIDAEELTPYMAPEDKARKLGEIEPEVWALWLDTIRKHKAEQIRIKQAEANRNGELVTEGLWQYASVEEQADRSPLKLPCNEWQLWIANLREKKGLELNRQAAVKAQSDLQQKRLKKLLPVSLPDSAHKANTGKLWELSEDKFIILYNSRKQEFEADQAAKLELQTIKDREEQDRLAALKQERMLKKASDYKKLNLWLEIITSIPPVAAGLTEEGQKIYDGIVEKHTAFINEARESIKTLEK